MKKSIASSVVTFAAAAGLLLTAGCASAGPITDDQFIAKLEGLSEFAPVVATEAGKAKLVALAEGICSDLEDEGDQRGREHYVDLFMMGRDGEGGDPAQAKQLIRASVERFCPELSID